MIKQIAFKYGIICALIGILVTVIQYVTGLDLGGGYLLNSIIGLIVLVIIIILGVKAVKEYRANNNGVISFSQAFLTAIATFAIYILISMTYAYIQNNYINPNYADKYKIVVIETMQERFDKYSVPEEKQEEILQAMSEKDYSFTPKKLLLAFGGFLILFAIISLIISATVKKDINQNSLE